MNEMELIPLLFPGSQRQIEAALRQIGRKFPDVDLSPVNIPSGENPQSAVLVPDIMQVMPGISQVTIISLVSLSSHALSRCPAHVNPVFASKNEVHVVVFCTSVRKVILLSDWRKLENTYRFWISIFHISKTVWSLILDLFSLVIGWGRVTDCMSIEWCNDYL